MTSSPTPFEEAPAEPGAGGAPLEMQDDAHGLDTAGWWALGLGLGLAVATLVVPLLETLVGYFVVLVHEMGHAAAGWLFGYPSLPAFDFRYGGGVTTHAGEQSRFIVVAVLCGLAVLGLAFRANRLTLGVVAGVTAVYAGLAFTGAHEAVIVAMGHGGELIFAFVFLQRAFTGSACKLPAERPLYAWIGFYIVFYSTGFAWRLATSALARAQYADAKGGGHWMDFSRLGRDHAHLSVEAIAGIFLVLCLVTPLVALAWSWIGPWRDELRLRLGQV
ncbi:MAG: hypothetical protein OEV20_09170 [Actinomycetota bacterium]|nr:hypothetical protein [Actinomycetota bacterium]